MQQELNFIYKGGKTKRYHTEDTLTVQTVAEHSFGVAMLVHLLAPDARKELIMAALVHDLAEHKIGDIPSPTKRSMPDLKQAVDTAEANLLLENDLIFILTDEEKAILKVADLFDGMLFCIRERKMGSTMSNAAFYNFLDYYCALEHAGSRQETQIIATIKRQWEKVNGSE